MKNIKKIAISGSPSSGKSTFSQKLRMIFNLLVYHLEPYFGNSLGLRMARPAIQASIV